MPEGQILDQQLAAPSEGRAGCADQKDKPTEHAPEYQPLTTSASAPRIRIDFCRPTAGKNHVTRDEAERGPKSIQLCSGSVSQQLATLPDACHEPRPLQPTGENG